MPIATGRDFYPDTVLSNVAINYQPNGLVAPDVAPIVTVNKQSGYFPVWDMADTLRVENDRRAPATEANVITRGVSNSTYFCQNYALKEKLPLEDRENMDGAYQYELRAGRVQYLTSKLTLNWEMRLASLCTNAANLGGFSSAATPWNNTAADPAADIWQAIESIQSNTGYKPNSILFSREAWNNFRKHGNVCHLCWGNAGEGKPRYASQDQVAAMFELDRVLVSQADYNKNAEGLTAEMTTVWGANVLIYYAPMTPSLAEPSFMYSFRWRRPEIPDMQAEVHPFDTRTKCEEVEVGYYQDEKITAQNLGYLISNTFV